ncbi:PilZ domain-containing protein [Methylobacterium sp. J-070]|uniref:PilZ domain-containing protein n=1 Tax=Methylobacterium sp. J-070 TaxID=2836650 RepID=UPI001FB98471|nr:PilZ domain-containing protein [Methylobacterium sp. J-070]MCJ2049014.1 PilZ domain-containing protein [Methylobacterium sp. J-070]
MIERRQTARRRVCLGGLVKVAAFLPGIDCRLRDVSLGGAKIRVSDADTVPACFDLFVPCRGEIRRAVVAWRAGAMVGVVFDGTPAVSEPESLARRLAASETQAARLRAALLAGNSLEPGCVH